VAHDRTIVGRGALLLVGVLDSGRPPPIVSAAVDTSISVELVAMT